MINKEIPKPNFIIIGSAKCGTTTLAKILSDHPDCCFSQPKEVSFFELDENYSQGWDWYQKHFAHYSGESVIGEATPAYSNRTQYPETAKRIYEFNPDIKLIYIVRDPLEKFISSWKMDYRASILYKDLPHVDVDYSALNGINSYFENPEYKYKIETCCFQYQLDAYFDYFTKDNILIIFLEDLANDIDKEIKKICDFLKISQKKNNIKNTTGENRSEKVFKEKKIWRLLRKSRLKKLIYPYFKNPLVKKFYDQYGRKRFSYPSANISIKNKEIFVEIVKNDTLIFLSNYNKPLNYWTSIL